jgi:sphingosine kinase
LGFLLISAAVARNPPLKPIPYYDILSASWCTTGDDKHTPTVLLSYILRTSTKPHCDAKVITRSWPAPKLVITEVAPFIHALLSKAYGQAQQDKRIKVLINPFGGRGQAKSLYTTSVEPIFKAANCKVDVVFTTHHGHGEEIAKDLDVDEWDVVACCSGDGVPHEVFNGLAQQENPRKALATVAVAQLPCGSGNGMSWNLNGTHSPALAALAIVKGLRTPMDLISITQDDGEGNVVRKLSFLSQAVGIVAECDLGTEDLRWMGNARFTIGFLIRLMRQTIWPVDVAIGIQLSDTKDIKAAYHKVHSSTGPLPDPLSSIDTDSPPSELPALKFGTINDPLPTTWHMTPYLNLGNFYAGNMAVMTEDSNVFPAALPADGCMDLVMIDGDIKRTRAIQMSADLATGGFLDADDVQYLKVVGYRIIPRQKTGYISIDGERYPFRGFQAEVHNALGCVLSRTGRVYEAKGPDRESDP